MSRLKFIPTAKLKEILNSHHITGTTGHDYWDHKEELEGILWERLNRENERISKEYFALMEQQLNEVAG